MDEQKFSQVVITLKSLLAQKKISVSVIRKMLSEKKITVEEYEYIINNR